MKFTKASVFLVGFFVALVIFWFSASFFDTGNAPKSFLTIFEGFKHNQTYGYIFNFSYSIMMIFAGLYGLKLAKMWGFLKSSMGKALFCLSLSLLFWALGELIWAYYNFFLNSNTPYPSWADAAYILTYPFLGAGLVYLGQVTGARFGLKNSKGKLFLLLLPVLILIFSWYVLVVIARGGSVTSGGGLLTVIFDIAYPVGDVIILTMAFLIYGLSFRFLGGIFKWPVFMTLIGVLVEYIADFAFSYTTTIGTYYNGDWIDLLYLVSLLFIALGVTTFDATDV